MMTVVNIVICALGLGLGIYTFFRHLNALNYHIRTPLIDAWLVAVGSLSWSVALYDTINPIIDSHSYESHVIGLTYAETLANGLFLIYWFGVLLQVQKHCLKIKLRRRKLEKGKVNE